MNSSEEQAIGVEWINTAELQDYKYSIYNLSEAYLRGKSTPQNALNLRPLLIKTRS